MKINKKQDSDHAQKGPGFGTPKAKAPARPAPLGTASRVASHSRGKDGKTK